MSSPPVISCGVWNHDDVKSGSYFLAVHFTFTPCFLPLICIFWSVQVSLAMISKHTISIDQTKPWIQEVVFDLLAAFCMMTKTLQKQYVWCLKELCMAWIRSNMLVSYYFFVVCNCKWWLWLAFVMFATWDKLWAHTSIYKQNIMLIQSCHLHGSTRDLFDTLKGDCMLSIIIAIKQHEFECKQYIIVVILLNQMLVNLLC